MLKHNSGVPETKQLAALCPEKNHKPWFQQNSNIYINEKNHEHQFYGSACF